MVWASLFCSACLIFATQSRFRALESTNMCESPHIWPQFNVEKCQGMTNLPQLFPMVSIGSANPAVVALTVRLRPIPSKITML
jgi:hypothetical protein